MGEVAIDRDKLREKVRLQGPHYRTWMFWRAIDLLSDEQIEATVASFIGLKDLRYDEGVMPPSPLEQVRRFHEENCQRKYYKEVAVTWRNCTEMSDGTTTWVEENRKDACVYRVKLYTTLVLTLLRGLAQVRGVLN